MKKPNKISLICCAVVSGFFAINLAVHLSMNLNQMEMIGSVSTSTSFSSLPCQYKGCGAESAKKMKVSLIDPYGSRIRESENYFINGRSYDTLSRQTRA